MGSVGIIAEYNPFHNGHLYQINKIKEMFPNDTIILVLSGNFTQRGEPAIIDKWKRVKVAIESGVDLVVELPFPFATQSADIFAYGSITILENLKVDKFVFGSELDDVNTLTTIAKTQVENDLFDQLVKIYIKMGENYPTAISKTIYDLTKKKVDTPNDLLGVSYIKTILKNNYKIKPITIKRTTNYHNETLKEITSAKTIRDNLKNNIDISISIPEYEKKYLDKLHYKDDYFNLLKYKIITSNNLEKYQTVDEGIENLIKKEIIKCNNYDELISKIKSKRYTYNKINRMLLHILIGFTKEDAKKMHDVEYIRILGFNNNGQNYLNKIKKEVNLPILSKYKRNIPMLDLELKSTIIYSIPKQERKLVKDEYTNHKKGDL